MRKNGYAEEYKEKNDKIMAKREAIWNDISGPRVGDWCKFPDGKMDRITHNWFGEKLQTGGGNGDGFFFGEGYMSYSGGLDPSIPIEKFVDSGELKSGRVWFFDGGYAGAFRGVVREMNFRVFNIIGG